MHVWTVGGSRRTEQTQGERANSTQASTSNEKHFFAPCEHSLSNQLPSGLEYRNQHQTAGCFYEAGDESKEGKEGAAASVAAASEISVAATLAAVSSALCDKFMLKKQQNSTRDSSQ